MEREKVGERKKERKRRERIDRRGERRESLPEMQWKVWRTVRMRTRSLCTTLYDLHYYCYR